MSYDLFLQPPLGTLLPLAEGKQLLEDFRNETNLDGPCEMTDMTEPDACPSDIEMMEECFRDGKLAREEYATFCSANNLVPTAGEQTASTAARLFLDFKLGQTLFSLTLPREDEEVYEAYRLIVEFARRHKIVIHDPQVGANIDLDNLSKFPPMWEPKKKPQPKKRGWFPWQKEKP